MVIEAAAALEGLRLEDLQERLEALERERRALLVFIRALRARGTIAAKANDSEGSDYSLQDAANNRPGAGVDARLP